MSAVGISTIISVGGIVAAVEWSRWNAGCSLLFSAAAAVLELVILQGMDRKIRKYFLELPAMLLAAGLLAGSLLVCGVPNHMGTLILNTLACGIFLTAGLTVIRWRQRGIQEECLKTVRITFAGETYTVTAITDTGNNLYDRRSGLPIHIVEQKSILKEGQKEQLLEKEPEKVTFVPYSSLGNSHGLLMVLQAEQMMILGNGKKVELKDQKLGLTDQKLDKEGKWQMLLHPDLEACMHEKGGCI